MQFCSPCLKNRYGEDIRSVLLSQVININFYHRKFEEFTAELHLIPVKADVWRTIGVDLIGPLPETERGNKYIMTASCLFSKWLEAKALSDKTADGVTEFLLECFTRHECCRVKITD